MNKYDITLPIALRYMLERRLIPFHAFHETRHFDRNIFFNDYYSERDLKEHHKSVLVMFSNPPQFAPSLTPGSVFLYTSQFSCPE